jgi:deazaflavin-dependent oxidoreductase (nitroreductase family)
MTASDSWNTDAWNDFNAALIEDFRAHNGKVTSGRFAGRELLLLITTGAKSGQLRTAPLAFTRDGERYVIIASKAGSPTNPDWYHNVVHNPDVTLELGGESFAARATIAQGEERDRLYANQAQQMPTFAAYQLKTTRQIPVVVLERLS